MNHKTKFVSVFLALMLALSLALPAMAAPETQENTNNDADFTATFGTGTGKITLNKAIFGQTYNLYRIFDLEEGNFDAEHNAYLYTVNSQWADFFKEGAEGAKYFQTNSEGYVTWIAQTNETDATREVRAQEFAQKALAFGQEKNLAVAAIKNGTFPDGTDSTAPTTNTINFAGLDLGYYLMDSTNGTLLQLTTAAKEAKVDNKNEAPKLEKTISKIESVDAVDRVTGNKIGSYGIGDTVTFDPTITVFAGTKDIVFHDKMDPGFAFQGSVTVTYDGRTLTAGTDYTFTSHVGEGTVACANVVGCTFDISFENSLFTDIVKGESKEIKIVYSAKVTADAPVNGEPLSNKGVLQFGNTHTETPPSDTKNYSFTIPVYKYAIPTNPETGAEQEKIPLKDAEFQLKAAGVNGALPAEDAAAYRFQKLTTGNDYMYLPKGIAAPDNADTSVEPNVTIKTDTTGKFNLMGLGKGTYYLYETKAPVPYNQLQYPIKVVIDYTEKEDKTGVIPSIKAYRPDDNGDYTVAIDAVGEDTNEVGVLNQSGTLLPETGGIGTTIFYIVGGCLCVGAVVLLVTKRRMNIGRE